MVPEVELRHISFGGFGDSYRDSTSGASIITDEELITVAVTETAETNVTLSKVKLRHLIYGDTHRISGHFLC